MPVLLKYDEVHRALGLARTPGEMTNFSAKAASFFHASGMLAFWPPTPTETTEVSLFPGVMSVGLVVAGCAAGLRTGVGWRRQSPGRSPFLFYAAAAVIMWAFAFGPGPQGSPGAWLRPYNVLTWLPGFNSLRVPARFAMLGTLCLAIAAGLGALRVLPTRRALRIVVAAVAIAGLAADGLMLPMPLAVPPGRAILPAVPDALVLELPQRRRDRYGGDVSIDARTAGRSSTATAATPRRITRFCLTRCAGGIPACSRSSPADGRS